MRTTLLFILSLLPLYLSLAQKPPYQEKHVIGSKPAMSIYSITLDTENHLYLTEMSRVVKVKDGEILLDFKVNAAEYNSGYDNEEGVVLQVAVDKEQFIYILNRKMMRIEKHDPQGKLIKTFPPVTLPHSDRIHYLSLHKDHNDRLHIFDSYDRKLFVYNTDGTLIETIMLADPDPIWGSDHTFFTFDNENNILIAELKKSSWSPTAHITRINREGKIMQRFSEAVMKESGFNKSYALAIAVDKNGDVYAYNNGSVYINTINWPIKVFSADGQLKKTLSVNALRGSLVLFDSQNNMYVRMISSSGDHILKYDQEQRLLEKIGNLRRPYEVEFDKADNLYILDHIKNEIIRYNAAGDEDKSFVLEDTKLISPLTFTIDDKGFIYVLEYSGQFNNPSSRIKKFDSDGNFLSILPSTIPGSYRGYQGNVSAGLAVDHTGNIYVTNFDNADTHALTKLNPRGEIIAKYGPKGKEPGQLSKPLDVTVDAAGNIYVLDMNGKRVQKFSSNGKFIQQYGSFNTSEGGFLIRASIASDAFGNVLVSTQTGTHSGDNSPDVKYFDLSGKLIFSAPINAPSVAMNRSGSMAAMANWNYDIVTVYGATSNREYNRIEGNIYHDANANCTLDETESGLADIVVKAEPGPYYAATDVAGNYSLLVGKGTYTVAPQIENRNGKAITLSCPSDDNATNINFNSYGNYSTGNNLGVKVTLSPYLNVSASSDRRRRCFENTTKVRYTNSGFAPAKDAKVYLQLPAEVELLSADKPYTRLANGTYVFAVGDLAAGQSGTITIQDIVTCGDESVRGRTVCTRAWITPSNNAPAKPTPTITITGQCNYDLGMVRFVIKNTGQADMTAPELFRKYIDGELSSIEQYRLAAGDSIVLWVPTSGMTVRLEADQPKGNGDNTLVSVTVEACRVSATQTGFSTGIVNLMPADEEEAEVSEECLLITDSFDPNDKLVTPVGRTAENYTPTNTALKYKIRFQNTGTDVAYRVVVVDTLSEHLDLSTLQLGAASHTHRFEVSGKGRPVLTWTFDNIMLPDSTADEPNSHGYIQFSIKPKADLPEKTAVENFADIFFDFNSPVRTNVTVNRIYDMPPVVNEAVRMDLEDILATPGITAFAPAAGRYGTEVVLSGKRFSGIAARNKVYFNSKPAQVITASATELRVLVPDGAATGSIKVVTPDGATSTTERFQVYQPPVLTSFSPAEGMVGQTVTLQGNHLDTDLIESIKLGTLTCEIVSNAAGTLVVKVPANAVTAKFEIVTKGGESLSPIAYVVWYQPAIHSLSKQTDIVGATITISGQNFASDPARNKVYFGKALAQVLQATPDMLTVKVPAGAESGFVTVETPGGKANSTLFEVIPGPKFTAMSPVKGSVGTEVEISGVHFLIMGQQDEIRFNGEKALVLEASADRFKVRVPRGATTGKVQITGFGGVDYSTTDFQIEELAPAEAILVYPNPTSGHFTVSLQHADFDVQAVEVYDAVGKLVHTTKVASPRPEKLEMNIRLSRSGIYTLHFKTDRGTITKKLTVL